MGFFSDLIKVSDPLEAFGGNPLHDDIREGADESIEQANKAVDLKKEQFELLREDSRPLRELRNENINRLLNLQGISGDPNLSGFDVSPEFTTVRDAAAGVDGLNSRQDIELQERAKRLGEGEFGNFRNRIFNTAGFSSSGLNNTNRLLQQNIDAQTDIFNNAAATGASGLISDANVRGNVAETGAGLLSMFCDKRLKDNAVQVGTYDIGIPKYKWEWSDEALTIVGGQIPEGPMAHEVQAIMPDNVHTVDGYLKIKDMRLIH